jgi:hypothetical protein
MQSNNTRNSCTSSHSVLNEVTVVCRPPDIKIKSRMLDLTKLYFYQPAPLLCLPSKLPSSNELQPLSHQMRASGVFIHLPRPRHETEKSVFAPMPPREAGPSIAPSTRRRSIFQAAKLPTPLPPVSLPVL